MSRRGTGRRRKRQSPRRRPLHEAGKVAVGFQDEIPAGTTEQVDQWKLPPAEQLVRATGSERARFLELLQELGAPLLLAGISFYRFTRLGEEEQRRRKPGRRTEQFHVEILQAIAVGRSDLWRNASGGRDRIDEALDLLPLFVNAISPDAEAAEEGELVRIVRGETRYVRNWAHPEQLLRLLARLFQPLDEQYRSRMGISLTQLVRLIQAISTTQNERFARFVAWHNDLAKSQPQEWFAIAQRHWPNLQSTLDIAMRADRSYDAELLHDPLPSLFIWSLDELGALVGANQTNGLASVLDAWSLRPGELNDMQPRDFLLSNPVWSRPFVRLDEGRYYLPFQGILYSFGLQLLEAACRLEPLTFDRYVKNRWRSRFLERELANLLERAFPRAQVYANNPFSGGQNDLTLRIDDFLLVFEAKSGRVSLPARRGALESLRRALREIVLDGSAQAHRFIEFLRQFQQRRQPAMLSDGKQISLEGVAEYIPLVAHLEPLGIIGADTKRIFRTLGADPTDRIPAMALNLADLETVFELLETVPERLHYLYRRRQLERLQRYAADELDLLATYFENQLIFDQRFASGEIFLYGRSLPVDRWLAQNQELRPVSRPRRQMSKRFEAAVQRLVTRRRPGWMRIALILQDVSDELQHDIELRLRRAPRLHRKSGDLIRTLTTTQLLTEGTLAVSLVTSMGATREEVREFVSDSMTRLTDSDQYREFLLIAVDLDIDSFPYSIIAAGAQLWTSRDSADAGVVLD